MKKLMKALLTLAVVVLTTLAVSIVAFAHEYTDYAYEVAGIEYYHTEYLYEAVEDEFYYAEFAYDAVEAVVYYYIGHEGCEYETSAQGFIGFAAMSSPINGPTSTPTGGGPAPPPPPVNHTPGTGGHNTGAPNACAGGSPGNGATGPSQGSSGAGWVHVGGDNPIALGP